MDFLENLPPLLKAFWYVAIPSSLIFLIQSIMTFVGTDAADGNSADFDGDMGEIHAPFQLFSLRNLINFLLGFSWSGISFYELIKNPILLVIISLIIGCFFVGIFFIIIRQIQKLAEDNTFNIRRLINQKGEVYLKVPSNKSGKGKVQISINGAFHELDAITEHDTLPTGSLVKVIDVIGNDLIIVEKI